MNSQDINRQGRSKGTLRAPSIPTLWLLICFAMTCPACDDKDNKPAGAAMSACASRRQAPMGDNGEPVTSLAEAALRKSSKPETIAAFDAYAATLPDPVATVAGLPMTRAAVLAEMMRIMPTGLPDDAAGQADLMKRAVGFLADGLRVQHAVALADLVTEVNERVDSLMKQKRGAHTSQADYEAAIASMWLSPVAHRWRWLTKVGVRAIARKRGAAEVSDREVKARYEAKPTALTDTDGNPMPFDQAKPFLRDIIAEQRLREGGERVMAGLLDNIDIEMAASR